MTVVSRSAAWRRGAVSLAPVLILAMLLQANQVGAAGGGQRNTRDAMRLTARAVELIAEERLPQALEELESAIAADPEYWEAHYQKGRVLGLLNRDLEARDALLTAAELNPGHAHTHYLAWLTAYAIMDYETAWDQAIRASLAGTDMNDKFLQMYAESEPPADFAARVRAPRVFVAEVDTREIFARAELPFNRNPLAGAPQIEDRSSDVAGVERVQERAFDLMRVQRFMRDALSDSLLFGVVLQPNRAKYGMVISVDAIESNAPVGIEGYVRLFDAESGDVVFHRPLLLRDITSVAVMHGELARFVNLLELWVMNVEQQD